jgi:hypothetical protein
MFFLASGQQVTFLATAQLQADRLPHKALAIAGGLVGEPSAVVGWWHKLAAELFSC